MTVKQILDLAAAGFTHEQIMGLAPILSENAASKDTVKNAEVSPDTEPPKNPHEVKNPTASQTPDNGQKDAIENIMRSLSTLSEQFKNYMMVERQPEMQTETAESALYGLATGKE